MTVVVDSSAWIGFFRGTEPVRTAVAELVDSGDAAVTDMTMAEVLAGPTDEAAAAQLGRFLGGADFLAQVSPVDAEAAAALHRACRRAGESPRSMADCLIAAVAMRHGVPVLHVDREFDVIARHTALEVLHP